MRKTLSALVVGLLVLSVCGCTRVWKLHVTEVAKREVELYQNDDPLSLTGFTVVDQERLRALNAEQVAELLNNDELGVIYFHLLSLDNFARLVDRSSKAA